MRRRLNHGNLAIVKASSG